MVNSYLDSVGLSNYSELEMHDIFEDLSRIQGFEDRKLRDYLHLFEEMSIKLPKNRKYVYSKNLSPILYMMLSEKASLEVTQKRHSLLENIIQSSDTQKNNLSELVYFYSQVERSLEYLYRGISNDDLAKKDLAHFPELLVNFGDYVSALYYFIDEHEESEELSSFALRAKGLLQEHEITGLGYLFSQGDGRIVFHEDEMSVSRVSLKNSAPVDIGKSNALLDFRNSVQQIKDIKRFCRDSLPFISVLSSFAYLSQYLDPSANLSFLSLYHSTARKSAHFCLPEINQEGRFSVDDAIPLSSNIQLSGAVNFDFTYTRENNKVILSGPHSGGKTELLFGIEKYHELGLAGLPLPALSSTIPFVKRIITSYKKETHANKGSLESEITQTTDVIKGLSKDDLVLWDEFLDTTKPELAAHIEEPLLERFAQTEAAVVLVSHRASSLRSDLGFRFFYPELKRLEKIVRSAVPEQDREVREEKLVPTRRFIEGKPKPELTREHALQMWEKIKQLER